MFAQQLTKYVCVNTQQDIIFLNNVILCVLTTQVQPEFVMMDCLRGVILYQMICSILLNLEDINWKDD